MVESRLACKGSCENISELQVIEQGIPMQPSCRRQVEYASLDPEVKNCGREVHLKIRDMMGRRRVGEAWSDAEKPESFAKSVSLRCLLEYSVCYHEFDVFIE